MGTNFSGKRKNGDGISSEQASYLTEGWFPANAKLLRRIQEKIGNGAYPGTAALLEDVLNDYALFAYTLRTYMSSVPADFQTLESNPMKILEQAPLASLASILAVPEGRISTHNLTDMVRDQAACLKGTLISSTTAETLAGKVGVDKNLTFSTSLLRQVGMNLVAWNYPRIYSKALASASSDGNTLERQLFKILGFAPRAIGVKLALPGPVNSGLLTMLGERQMSVEGDAPPSEQALMVSKFCELGESFSRVNDPEHFTVSQKEWDGLVGDITHYLGRDGMNKILSQVNEKFASYTAVVPKVFDISITPEKNVRLSGLYHGKRLLLANNYIAKCTDLLRTKFQAVYSAMTPGDVSIRALELLMTEVIPRAGFTRGCVYLMDRDNTYLVPRLKIGEGQIQRYKAVRCETEVLSDHPIVNALFSSIPLKQKDVILHGERVSHISGSLGSGERTGVLYLEMAEDAADSLDNEQVTFFRAIQQAVNDCLGI